MQQTRLLENFSMAVTNPRFQPGLPWPGSVPLLLPDVTNPAECAAINPGAIANPNLLPGLVPYDLTRGGSYFHIPRQGQHRPAGVLCHRRHQAGRFHRGPRTAIRPIQRPCRQERHRTAGWAFRITCIPPDTVLRIAYSRTMETPFNENLLLSSATGAGGLAQNVFGAKAQHSASSPAPAISSTAACSRRSAAGGHSTRITSGNSRTTPTTSTFCSIRPITFPIAWHNSKIDGVTGRLSTNTISRVHGLQPPSATPAPAISRPKSEA